MKREHNIENLPFQENLVFYAPLTNWDLTDWISGNEFVTSGNGTIQWNSVKEAYQISTPTTRTRFVMSINVDLGITLTNQSEYTIFAKILPNTIQASVIEPFVGLGNWSESSFKPHINSSTNFVSSTANFNYSAYEGLDNNGSGRICRYYVYGKDEYNDYSHVSNPAQWNNTNKCKNMLCVGVNRNGNAMTFCIKDIMVFDRRLTPEEIKTL